MKRSHFILVMVAAATLSFNMVLLRRARMDYPVALVGLAQMFMTSWGLLAYALIRQGREIFKGIRRDIPTALTIGVIACGITAAILEGIGKSTATNGAVLQRTDILFTMFIGYFLVGDRFRRSDWLFLALLTLGAMEVMELKHDSFELVNPYNLYFIASALGISINAFLIKYRIKEINWAMLAWINTVVQTCFYTVWVFAFYRDESFAALREHPGTMWWLVGAAAWLVAYFLAYYESLERLPVWFVRTFLLTMPVFTLAMEYPLFGTTLSIRQYLGILMVTAGVLGLTLARRKSPAQMGRA